MGLMDAPGGGGGGPWAQSLVSVTVKGEAPAAARRDDSLAIPFVFREVTHLFDDGAPRVWNACTPENG